MNSFVDNYCPTCFIMDEMKKESLTVIAK
ncbi:hypothetical protein [Gemella cuniculi]